MSVDKTKIIKVYSTYKKYKEKKLMEFKVMAEETKTKNTLAEIYRNYIRICKESNQNPDKMKKLRKKMKKINEKYGRKIGKNYSKESILHECHFNDLKKIREEVKEYIEQLKMDREEELMKTNELDNPDVKDDTRANIDRYYDDKINELVDKLRNTLDSIRMKKDNSNGS